MSNARFSPFSRASPVKSKINAKFVRWLQRHTVSFSVDISNETLHPKENHDKCASTQNTHVLLETSTFSIRQGYKLKMYFNASNVER